MYRREAARLFKNLDGIRTMDKYPAAMFIVDIKREHNAVAEGRRLKIPIVAMVDTNCDPELVDLPHRRQRRRHPLGAADFADRRADHHPGPRANTRPNTAAAKREQAESAPPRPRPRPLRARRARVRRSPTPPALAACQPRRGRPLIAPAAT